MLAQFISEYFSFYWGPLRLLESITVLSSVGALSAALLTLFVLPKVWHLATRDKGRNHAHNAEASIGKPLGVGIFMNIIFFVLVLVLVPWDPRFYICAAAILVASAVGLADDAKPGGFSELTLGLSDFVLAVVACFAILYGRTLHLWLPFSSTHLELPFWAGVLIFSPVIWISVNALNCNDGVDGLSGMLSTITLTALGFVLYSVVGHIENSKYLLIPFNPDAPTWVIGTAIMCGTIMGYLWHNAPPSAALMGDAGSRPIGLFIGMVITVTGNPLMLLFVALMILVNGATGLLKVGLIRVFRVRIFKTIRFPLHDHMRKTLQWSNSQVLIRFTLIHFVTLLVLMMVLLKVR
jgi:phospho-N-acetylmuramoyl-pentapeptide-transferase